VDWGIEWEESANEDGSRNWQIIEGENPENITIEIENNWAIYT